MKKSRGLIILSIILMLTVLATAAGVSFAVWTTEGGEDVYAPIVNTIDWNVWQKYFDCVPVYDGNGVADSNVIGAAVVSYSGVNLGDVVIPMKAECKTSDGRSLGEKTVIEIRNSLFNNPTLKRVPVSITIPPSVIIIEQNAFADLPNLAKIIFGSDGEAVDKSTQCNVGPYAFLGCAQLKSIEIQGWRKINFSDFVFTGTGLNSVAKAATAPAFNYTSTTFTGSSYTPS